MVVPALASGVFPDVPSNHPYVTAIGGARLRNIIGGYTNGNFGPEDLVKRQQFAKMIVLTMGFQTTEADVCTFKDVLPADSVDPLYPDHYIAVAARTGLTTAIQTIPSGPFNQITRQQVITMVVRAGGADLEAPPADWVGVLNYSDPTHGANIRNAEFNHLLDGLVGLSYSWNAYANASRGECAQLLYNLLLIRGGGTGRPPRRPTYPVQQRPPSLPLLLQPCPQGGRPSISPRPAPSITATGAGIWMKAR